MARDFDGATHRIDYANVTNPIGKAQTCSMWVWVDTLDAVSQFMWMSQLITTNVSSSIFFLLATTDLICFSSSGGTWLNRYSDQVIATGSWQHVLYTWDGSTTAANCHIYYNGSETGYSSTINGVSLVAGTGSWSLGGRILADDRCLDGKLAGVGWWNRILGAAEIAALAAGFSPWCISSGLMFAPDLDGFGGVDDPISGKVASLDGTTAYAHPPIQYPSRGIVLPRAGAPPAFAGSSKILGGNVI